MYLAIEIPDGNSALPMSFPFFLALWVLAGAVWGRWNALVLPFIYFVIILISDVESNPAGDQPLWTYVLMAAVIYGVPLTAVGIGIRKSINRQTSGRSGT